MNAEPDYFSNHALKLRFPWSLYHEPIVSALSRVIALSPGPDLLNLGSGPFHELEQLNLRGRRLTLCDIDARAIEAAKRRYGARIAAADVTVPGAPLPYADGSFDLVVSMDVVEHVPNPAPWLHEALRVVRPGGTLFLTTPNYGSLSLRVLEPTVLELIARLQHFSRKDLHPSKMNADRLTSLLRHAGAKVTHVEPISHGWVLAAYARKQA
ncbi:MAG: methyltransferase domain-containing protein [Polyangiaceae bacterium]